MKIGSEYYLGLDVGTDSVGYAVTDANYNLQKFKGEPMWGATLFDAANTAAERRSFRTGRRRTDRRQQRVKLLEELFAPEICKIDPNFFLRRRESALFAEDTAHGVQLFDGGDLTDKVYHKQYPTIHHLIVDLMQSSEPHDIRLVYLACAWLVAHRGHFLLDIPAENTADILNFEKTYQDFLNYLEDQGYDLPWICDFPANEIRDVLRQERSITWKSEALTQKLFGGKKPPKNIPDGEEPFLDAAELVNCLAGKKIKVATLFGKEEYADIKVSLTDDDEAFAAALANLGDDGELLTRLRAISDCAMLTAAMKGTDCLSAAKVQIYEQHKQDLKALKRLVKTYCPEKYNKIFRDAVADNYASYSKNARSMPEKTASKLKHTTKGNFCAFLRKELKELPVREKDRAVYDDMMARLETNTFLPKQVDGDNRVIPQQLYRHELQLLLDQAAHYTPLLKERDADGLSVQEKILAIFSFKIPYFVGPLKTGGPNAWIVRKAEGKILPWNFETLVDLEQSEQAFIRRMTNHCTYLPGEDVLPVASLVYEQFKVLNELNNLKVDGRKLDVTVKQELYHDLFEKKKKVSKKELKQYLENRGQIGEISGLDEVIKSSLNSYHIFRRLLENGALTEADAERIIEHAAYAEDKARMRRWLQTEYSSLSKTDIDDLLRQNFKGFGRLSHRFLTGFYGTEQDSDGEAHTILELLMDTNENLMQLLSDRYTFRENLRAFQKEYYAAHPQTLEDRLNDLYISSGVKRSIYRTLDIVQDVVKAAGGAPKKIFLEMARGGTPDQKGKRTESRKKQLLDLYKAVKDKDVKDLIKELEKGLEDTHIDARLQSRRLFLYYLQLGKSAYTGAPISLKSIVEDDGTYNLDHIYPQCHVKDDSLLNNLVLVESTENGHKADRYPLEKSIQQEQIGFWRCLKKAGLMTDEKFRRLTRSTSFSPEEQYGFINRQLVETRQSTKALATLLQERYPESELVYVKAGLVSEFRHEFDMLKCRSINDLHHAKDAYLNIVVGDVYKQRFAKPWFSPENYNVQVKKIFQNELKHGDLCYWHGETDVKRIQKVMRNNAVHLTRYAFCKTGKLFDQQPVRKAPGLVPRKQNLPTEKYGGYNKPSASFFVLARYCVKKKREVMIVPINLMDAPHFLEDKDFALRKTAEMIAAISDKQPEQTELLLNGRILKIGTLFSVDGLLLTLSGKSGKKQVIFSPLMPLLSCAEDEAEFRKLESFMNKRSKDKNLNPDAKFDEITPETNLHLYDLLTQKLEAWPYSKLPANQAATLKKAGAREQFEAAPLIQQMQLLLGLLQLLNGRAKNCDLTAAGGSKAAGTILMSRTFSNWTQYQDVRILDRSASGLFEQRSENLLKFL